MKAKLAVAILLLVNVLFSCTKVETCSCQGKTVETLKDVPMSFVDRGTRGFLYRSGSGLFAYTVCDSTKLIPFSGVPLVIPKDSAAYVKEYNLLVSGKVKCYEGPCSIVGCPLGYLEITEVKSRR